MNKKEIMMWLCMIDAPETVSERVEELQVLLSKVTTDKDKEIAELKETLKRAHEIFGFESDKLARLVAIPDKTLTKLCKDLDIPLWKGMEIAKHEKGKLKLSKS